ncbi:MAG: secondary thiamine-phosphate synthase enzyme YjbQ [Nitrososphaerota archaeon]|nr:secondary thiamine-phosphate synthase enzyme YjbQ [Candidatus Bathyarchaeota archaeon]MDW8062287.1 secondary thiamine-phosphate synthase enzyme YjbQ [Nitrososphaerota archaeon]
MKIYQEVITFKTKGEGDFVDITSMVESVIARSEIRNGLINVFAPHATGVIGVTEYDPSLLKDIWDTLNTLIPRNRSYRHPENAHSHIRSLLLSPSKTFPLIDGKIALGTWQSVFFIEVDTTPRTRRIIVQVIGE